MTPFYTLVIESVILHDCVVWYNGAKKMDKDKLKRGVKQASRILGVDINLDVVCRERVLTEAQGVLENDDHSLNNHFIMLGSGRRWQSVRTRTNRYLNSFVPYSIRLLNDQHRR